MSLGILAVSGIPDCLILSVLQMPGMGIITSRILKTAAVVGVGSGHGGGTDLLFAKAHAGGFSFRHRDADALPNKGFETGFRDEWRKEKFGNYMNSNDSSGSCKAVYLGFGSGGRFYCHQASSQ